jgi:hypothetical protein
MVKWGDVPVCECNGNLTNYLVLYAKNHTSEYTEAILDSNSSHVELRNLEIFRPYKIRVVARNRRGEGVPSLPFVVWTEMEGTKDLNQRLLYRIASPSINCFRWLSRIRQFSVL